MTQVNWIPEDALPNLLSAQQRLRAELQHEGIDDPRILDATAFIGPLYRMFARGSKDTSGGIALGDFMFNLSSGDVVYRDVFENKSLKCHFSPIALTPPSSAALMLQALELPEDRKSLRILELGLDSGYVGCLLENIVAPVHLDTCGYMGGEEHANYNQSLVKTIASIRVVLGNHARQYLPETHALPHEALAEGQFYSIKPLVYIRDGNFGSGENADIIDTAVDEAFSKAADTSEILDLDAWALNLTSALAEKRYDRVIINQAIPMSLALAIVEKCMDKNGIMVAPMWNDRRGDDPSCQRLCQMTYDASQEMWFVKTFGNSVKFRCLDLEGSEEFITQRWMDIPVQGRNPIPGAQKSSRIWTPRGINL